MAIFTYDIIIVYRGKNLLVFKDVNTKEELIIHKDKEGFHLGRRYYLYSSKYPEKFKKLKDCLLHYLPHFNCKKEK